MIRPLTSPDIPACDAILRSLPDWFGIEEAIVRYVHHLESLDGYVAEVDGQVVGLIGLQRHNPQSVEIEVLAVRPEHRGQGIGSALIRQVETSLRGQAHMLLHTKTVLRNLRKTAQGRLPIGSCFIEDCQTRVRSSVLSTGV